MRAKQVFKIIGLNGQKRKHPNFLDTDIVSKILTPRCNTHPQAKL
ncbi:MAG: hypothetical protein ACLFUS_05340 [Candidatus Sumerlaeia bacterium]